MIDLRHYGHDDLSQIRQVLLDVHADIPEYHVGSEFDERFPWFVDHWGGQPEYRCVIGYDETEPVGFVYGAPATKGREWWRDTPYPEPKSSLTFAVSELMVRPKWRKSGVAEELHRALLEGRPEDLAVLLVDVTHPKVQERYESWGYKKAGERQPFADSPVYAVLVKELFEQAAS
ncbi:GNAT family N-acetyltransferase [Streptomyces sp. NPDC057199]|uniref:GNAT family N-acetyltransferase n=1 Tax=Streptomyces sp. NPDC057199 TaxID=3346047 RepID=UPI003629E43C